MNEIDYKLNKIFLFLIIKTSKRNVFKRGIKFIIKRPQKAKNIRPEPAVWSDANMFLETTKNTAQLLPCEEQFKSF